jgi:alpha-L-fucosidase
MPSFIVTVIEAIITKEACVITSRRQAIGLFGAGLTGLHLQAGAQGRIEKPQGIGIPPGVFEGSRGSLTSYEVPAWFRDAKFGIWAHWGPQSAIEAGDWYARNMYLQGSKQYNYHVQHYGHPSGFGYKDTIPAWKADRFDPAALMKLYKAAGAKYFMSMGCHHDNFDMWKSKWNRWNVSEMGPKRDVVGAWRDAARSEGLHFGVSEHLWIAYKWFSVSHGHDLEGALSGASYDGANPALADLYIDSDQIWRTLDWNEDGIPDWWKKHWYMRMRDLLDSYEPDFLYSDGPLPFQDYGLNIVAHLYNLSAKRSGGKVEGVYFSKRDQDSEVGTCVLDRERALLMDISPRPWQTDTCIGDWHYLRGMEYKTPKMIIDMLVRHHQQEWQPHAQLSVAG